MLKGLSSAAQASEMLRELEVITIVLTLQSSPRSRVCRSSWSILPFCLCHRWCASRATFLAEMALISMALAAHSTALR
ncbi:hypothetical protein INR49_015209 [Caranx melampygus]|nr:hypothetical protein INR49_015209 [Caranx melampygus]